MPNEPLTFEFGVTVFEGREKLVNLEKNLLEQGRE